MMNTYMDNFLRACSYYSKHNFINSLYNLVGVVIILPLHRCEKCSAVLLWLYFYLGSRLKI